MTLRMTLLVALATLATPIWAADGKTGDDPTAALVRAMRVETLIAAGMKYGLTHGEKASQLPQEVKDCLQQADLSFLHGMYVQEINAALTPEEIAAALAYYQSRAGYLDTMGMIRQQRSRLEGNPLLAEADAAGEPNEAESRRMKEFAGSTASRKIGQIHTEEFKQRLSQTSLEKLRAQCIKPP